MRFWCISGLWLAAMLSCAMGQSSTPDKGTPAAHSGADFCRQIEKDTFLLVNQYRLKNNLPALAWNDAITKIARAHSKDMASGDVDFGHEGFNDRVHQLKDLMPGFGGAGENVLMSDGRDNIARAALDLWLKSPHHLKNIRGDYNYSGMGVWENSDGVIYFTQIFFKSVPPQPQAAADPSTSTTQTPFGFLPDPRTR